MRLIFSYKPQKTVSNVEDQYHACFVKIIKLNCKLLKETRLGPGDSSSLRTTLKTVDSFQHLSSSLDLMQEEPVNEVDNSLFAGQYQLSNYLRIFLFGTVEEPNVQAIPNHISVGDIQLGKTEYRTIILQNNSKKLPITIKYIKSSTVRVEPHTFTINPNSSIETKITIKLLKIGPKKINLHFDLVHEQYKDKETTVGRVDVHLEFNCPAESKYPTCICPLDIGTFSAKEKISNPIIPYASQINPLKYTKTEKLLKASQKTYYVNWMRQRGLARLSKRRIEEDYDITNKKLLLAKDIPVISKIPRSLKDKSVPSFLPLTSEQLTKVSIYPRSIWLDELVHGSLETCSVSIKNENNFSIRAALVVKFSNIHIPSGTLYILDPHQEKSINILCWAPRTMGLFERSIDIVLNETIVLEVSISGEVVQMKLITDCTEIEFEDEDSKIKYIDLYNPFSISLDYWWSLRVSAFQCIPRIGVVPSNKHILVKIEYFPEKNLSTRTDFQLIVDGICCKTIYVSAKLHEASVSIIPKEIVLNAVPLNIPLSFSIHLRNSASLPCSYSIFENTYDNNLSLSSTSGTLFGDSFKILNIQILKSVIASFQYELKFRIQYKVFSVYIVGEVQGPCIIPNPADITFRKIPVYSTDRAYFKLQNYGRTSTIVKFPLGECKELTVTDSQCLTKIDELLMQPDEIKQLCLHYKPVDVSYTLLYLPTILNNIFGPPNSTFMKSIVDLRKSMHKSNELCIPVKAISQKAIITFSSWNIELRYFPHPKYKNKTKRRLIVSNPRYEEVQVCIRTDNLNSDFTISHIEGGDLDFRSKSISFRLGSKEEIIFEIEFAPIEQNIISVKLPVYIKDYLDGSIFNFLQIAGTFPPSEIYLPVTDRVYLLPVPLKTVNETELKFEAKYHLDGCYVSYYSEDCDVILDLGDFKGFNKDFLFQSITLWLSCSSNYPKAINSTVTLECTCGATYSFQVLTCFENCTITCHAFYKMYALHKWQLDYFTTGPRQAVLEGDQDLDSLSIEEVDVMYEQARNKNDTCFPYFPEPEEKSSYAIHMRFTVQTLETWVYQQVFNYKQFHKIPNGFSVPLVADGITFPSHKFKIRVPFFDLLANLIGGAKLTNAFLKLEDFQADSKLKYEVKVMKLWTAYDKVKKFLEGKAAYIPNIHPEYLLTYRQYLVYTHTKNVNQVLSEENFKLMTMQCWIDLLLQTYKVFVFMRIKPRSELESKSTLTDNISKVFSVDSEHRLSPLYHSTEIILMEWLEFTYQNYYQLVLENAQPKKKISFLEWDCSDAYILAIATVRYCPYLVKMFQALYIPATCFDEALYNASQLVRVWETIGVSFQIRAEEIVEPHPIQALMLVAYLYDFLPDLQPNAVLRIKTQLGKTSSSLVTIANTNDFVVKYRVVIFDSDNGGFSTDKDEFTIDPKSEVQLMVNYFAKFLKNFKAYLLLIGECRKYKFAKSKCYEVYGYTVIASLPLVSLNATIRKVNETELKLRCPYGVESTWNIKFLKETPPDNVEEANFTEYEEMIEFRLPIPVFWFKKELETDKNGRCKVRIAYTSVRKTDIQYVYFVSETEGAWGIKLQINRISGEEVETITMPLSQLNIDGKCLCSSMKDRCPKVLNIPIPRRHNHLWTCIEQIFMCRLKGEDMCIKFWTKYFRTRLGCVLLRNIFRAGKPYIWPQIQYLLSETLLEYDVDVLKNDANIEIPSTISFAPSPENDTFAYLKVHLRDNQVPNEIWIGLKNAQYAEKRKYSVQFSVENK